MIKREDAKKVAKKLKIDFSKELYTLADFHRGMKIELEHGTKIDNEPSPITNITNDDFKMTGQIALAHLKEEFRYYDLKIGLPAMEKKLKKTRASAIKKARKK
jgi:hypothetical protein